jgi:hypothetical protein
MSIMETPIPSTLYIGISTLIGPFWAHMLTSNSTKIWCLLPLSFQNFLIYLLLFFPLLCIYLP